mmetsp:Transcript_5972/g.14478  ORF Transcript_5972/g.14478 Transcript_5972/m.14478 type:complete len:572 (-) Transcript_5972:108-1823(-)
MDVFGKAESPPRDREEGQLIHHNGGVDKTISHNDLSSYENRYEPPPVFTTKITVADVSAAADVISGENDITKNNGLIPEREGSPTAEIFASDDMTSNNRGANTDEMKSNASAAEISSGCCSSESFEIEYDKERFSNLKNKRFSSFSQRWKSFRDDQLANFRAGRRWHPQRNNGGDDERTLSSGDSSNNSYERYAEENEDSASEEYQHFSFFRCGENRHKRSTQKSYPASLDADLDVLVRNPCNAYARRQFEVWRAASIEGPGGLKTTAFVTALSLLLTSVGVVFAKSGQHFWTPGAIVACCHLVVASLLILLLESRSNLTGKGILRDLVTCGCSGKSVEDDLTENFYHATVLPMDAYQEYGDQHYALEGDRAAKPRHDVVRNVRFFRFLHGRGLLCVFAGSMAFATIPGHLSDCPSVVLAICIPGVALMLVGLSAIVAGVYALFRWTLLETSIVGDDEHLLEKFRSAGRSLLKKSEQYNNDIVGLNQKGFSVLVTTLGLDLDEITLIPTVFALEVRPKDLNAMTFEEFKKWWRGNGVGKRRRRTKSQGTNASEKDKNSLSSLPSSSQNSVV